MANATVAHDFFRLAFSAIRDEDRVLRKLFKGRPAYARYPSGVRTVYETGTVYVVFKALLASAFSDQWTVNWEAPHDIGKQHIDLRLDRCGPGRRNRVGVEVKWWLNKGAGVVADCQKLCTDPTLTSRLVLVLHAWTTERNCWTLKKILERAIGEGRFISAVSIEEYEELDVLAPYGGPERLGVALLRVL